MVWGWLLTEDWSTGFILIRSQVLKAQISSSYLSMVLSPEVPGLVWLRGADSYPINLPIDSTRWSLGAEVTWVWVTQLHPKAAASRIQGGEDCLREGQPCGALHTSVYKDRPILSVEYCLKHKRRNIYFLLEVRCSNHDKESVIQCIRGPKTSHRGSEPCILQVLGVTFRNNFWFPIIID